MQRRVICKAIEQHRLLELHYEGQFRIVEPHVYGHDGGDVILLRAYQIAGGSGSRAPVGWKMFDTAKIGRLDILDTCFEGARPDYQPQERVIHEIYRQL